uniref:protein-serine/threonine phosphatase n=2 Tax=Oryza brachyantha TaxID=4533 RepID=J3NC35_ORYBR
MASRRGVRHAMEDAYGVIARHKVEGASQLAFYGVYDGHGGRAAVDFVADRLGKNVVAAVTAAAAAVSTTTPSRHHAGPSSPSQQRLQEDNDLTAAIRAAYLTTDSEFLSQGVRGGACAATALLRDGELYVSNVGDCRAVLGSHGGVATALTSDQTPGREDERLRIESSGGYVSCGGSGVWRVQDSLAVSRAFGDAGVKPWGVTCEPETTRRRLTTDCRFLVLASDGLWCKVSNQEAVDAVVSAAVLPSTDPCKELVAMARSRGSRDDITVMVIDLQPFLPTELSRVK